MPRRMPGSEERLMRQLRRRAFHKQGRECWWCHATMHEVVEQGNDDRYCTADHLVPLHAGGRTTAANIVAACRRCNSERHPEMNKMGGGVVASAGDMAHVSPFAILR